MMIVAAPKDNFVISIRRRRQPIECFIKTLCRLSFIRMAIAIQAPGAKCYYYNKGIKTFTFYLLSEVHHRQLRPMVHWVFKNCHRYFAYKKVRLLYYGLQNGMECHPSFKVPYPPAFLKSF